MEQLAARRAHNPKVGGSSPPPATKVDNSRELSTFFILMIFIYEVSVQVVEDFKNIWINEKKRFSKNRVIIFIHFSAKPRKGF